MPCPCCPPGPQARDRCCWLRAQSQQDCTIRPGTGKVWGDESPGLMSLPSRPQAHGLAPALGFLITSRWCLSGVLLWSSARKGGLRGPQRSARVNACDERGLIMQPDRHGGWSGLWPVLPLREVDEGQRDRGAWAWRDPWQDPAGGISSFLSMLSGKVVKSTGRALDSTEAAQTPGKSVLSQPASSYH